ncbi:oligopeptide transport system ATP-binding protein [Aminivibrio pyruvatiphilus]|jgi:oligopeptide transport system ATP-binding protein|uniref:Oligopeptide transport system ATP-binding protein n=1 Tax=Aminivibrio pyruvatiphilus TaxID=1005740 RepID=A0A4R8MCX5_9BACT|nr:ABC transporter ATP-binding protein [Aminivibrio pyruvatiphilus]TDY62838.1 oligopeptide transport system ATP-binding protein [Aminivibrio pyruvatiphilus]
MSEYLLEVRNLQTRFELFRGTVKAVDGVDFTLREGEILGIVGESGGGKSVTGFSLLGLIDPPGRVAAGEVIFRGENLLEKSEEEMRRIRGKEISMIFQDPMTSLNPLQTIGRQIDEMLALHTPLSQADRRKRSLELLREVGIPNPEDRLENYPHQFSGGMRQRVVIAIALAANPKLIIADEPTTALDVTVQAQILALMENLVKRFGSALILITHDLAVVSEMTHRVAVMYCGRVVEEGPTRELVHNPFHPYTKGLLESIPRLSGERSRRLPQIPGMVPNLFDLPPGCSFAPRCGYATELCRKEAPRMRTVAPGRMVSCHNPVQGGEEAEGHGR